MNATDIITNEDRELQDILTTIGVAIGRQRGGPLDRGDGETIIDCAAMLAQYVAETRGLTYHENNPDD